MIESLSLRGVGPAPSLGPIEFGERVNVITGDNGLGKSFLLDVAWWSLTGSWPKSPAWPRPETGPDAPPSIQAMVRGKKTAAEIESTYDFAAEEWSRSSGRPPMPGLVLYFRVDGRFSLWDPAQHYWRRSKTKGVDDPLRPEALHLSLDESWNSVVAGDGKTICRGLIEDWVTWQQTSSREFEALRRVLELLSPESPEKLIPGPPKQVWLDDRRLHPTLALPYGNVPVTLASAGMQRVLMMAYLLVWAWEGHVRASQILRQDAERRIVVLFDEPETHLHPRWQRTLLPSLLSAIGALQGQLELQMLVSTHAPLVLSSIEPLFDATLDRMLELSLDEEEGAVTIDSPPFVKRGDVVSWLVSDTFGLRQARSLPAEEAIEAAERFMRGEAEDNPAHLRTSAQIHEELLGLLGDRDPFWPRWIVATDKGLAQ
jgi:AAA domain, putative AbiEii toxin, Type IV TA system